MSVSNTRRTIRLTVCSDRNWFEFVSLLDGTFAEPESEDAQERVTKTRQFLESIKEKDGKADRSAHLAALELEKRAREHKLSSGEHYKSNHLHLLILVQSPFFRS